MSVKVNGGRKMRNFIDQETMENYDYEAELKHALSEENVEEEDLFETEGAETSDSGSMDAYALYMRDVSAFPLLSAEEESALAKKIAEGDKEAEKTFINCNLRLVVSIAGKLRGKNVPILDMIQAGNTGLITAVRKFDYKMGYRFSTYATWWIKQSITRYMADCERTIRVPIHMNDTMTKVRKTTAEMTMRLGRRPGFDEIAQELGMSPRKVEDILTTGQDVVSLNTIVGEEGDTTLEDFVADPNGRTPEELTFARLKKEELMKAVGTLTEREQYVILNRYGFAGAPRTLEEIGNELGITRERVRQIEAKALRKLKSPRIARSIERYAI